MYVLSSRCCRIRRGVVALEGPQKFAAEISTVRRSLLVVELKLRLSGAGRSFFCLARDLGFHVVGRDLSSCDSIMSCRRLRVFWSLVSHVTCDHVVADGVALFLPIYSVCILIPKYVFFFPSRRHVSGIWYL